MVFPFGADGVDFILQGRRVHGAHGYKHFNILAVAFSAVTVGGQADFKISRHFIDQLGGHTLGDGDFGLASS